MFTENLFVLKFNTLRILYIYKVKKGLIMKFSDIPYKIILDEKEIPSQWYNVRADMKNKPAPLLNPGTLKPLTFEEMQPIFCDEPSRQE